MDLKIAFVLVLCVFSGSAHASWDFLNPFKVFDADAEPKTAVRGINTIGKGIVDAFTGQRGGGGSGNVAVNVGSGFVGALGKGAATLVDLGANAANAFIHGAVEYIQDSSGNWLPATSPMGK